MPGSLSVSANKLIAIKLARFRRFSSAFRGAGEYLDCAEYRQLMREIGMLLAYEVGDDLSVEKIEFETPRGMAVGAALRGNFSVVVPILRTGLVLAEGFQSVLSHTHTGHIGLHRIKDHPERQLLQYLVVLPDPDPPDRLFIIIDSVIATGDTADRAIRLVKEHGATNISFVSVIASRPAISRLTQEHDDVNFYTTEIDDVLDEHGRVLPGLGSVSELLFGFKTTTSG